MTVNGGNQPQQQIAQNATIPLSEVVDSLGEELTASNNGIRIGRGISKVKVSATVFLGYGDTLTSSYAWVGLCKNGVNLPFNSIQNMEGAKYSSASITDVILSVQEGDIIAVNMVNSYVVRPANSWLTVEATN